MVDFLFYFFSALILGAAVLVVINRNPVNAAMFLLVTMASAAALFLLLGAFFLAFVHILVYAGAVVVLFLFIIMLIDPATRIRVFPNKATIAGSALALAILAAAGLHIAFAEGTVTSAVLGETAPVGSVSKEYGYYLFSVYLLPVQVAGFLLLIAMIGVIYLSRRYEAKKELS